MGVEKRGGVLPKLELGWLYSTEVLMGRREVTDIHTYIHIVVTWS